MNRLDKTELIFKVLAYTVATLFAIAALYPFIYTFSSAISGRQAVESGSVILFPVDVQWDAFNDIIRGQYAKGFWIAYSNTIFYTLYGTLFSMLISVFAGYALSKDRLIFRRQINFLIVFTMWFSAGMIPTYLNYKRLGVDGRWGIIFAFGAQAFNIVLLRNYFSGISKEIEEAAIIDGANEFQVLWKIYIPMSKAAMATVTLFYALNRWNGYFWNRILVPDVDHPLQVFLRIYLDTTVNDPDQSLFNYNYSTQSMLYAMIVMSIIPIIIIYPYLQRYFAQGVNVGGVKE